MTEQIQFGKVEHDPDYVKKYYNRWNARQRKQLHDHIHDRIEIQEGRKFKHDKTGKPIKTNEPQMLGTLKTALTLLKEVMQSRGEL